ncbi:unnamed protein product [Ixodes hexagonus]
MEVRWTAFLLTSAWLYSCATASRSASSKQYSSAVTPWKQWTIGRRPCEGVQGETGMCMFNWECIRQEGTMLAACMDGFLLGACCKLPEEINTTTASWTEHSAYTTPDSLKDSSNPDTTTSASEQSSTWSTHHLPEASRLPPSTTTEPPSTVPATVVRPTTLVARPTTLWPFIRLPTTLKRPTLVQASTSQGTATVTNHHRPPTAATPLVTAWMTTRPGMLFTPTRLTLRPTHFPSTPVYIQRPSLQSVLANTPIGILGSLLTRPFTRPMTRPVTPTLFSRPQTVSILPQKTRPTPPMQSDSPTKNPQTHEVPSTEPPVRTTTPEPFTSIAGEISSHAVSRLPPATLNALEDLAASLKTPHVRFTTVSQFPTAPNEGTVSQPAFIDLTEFATTRRPPTTASIEYTLDFDVEEHPTVTENVNAVSVGRPSYGEVADVTVTQVASTIAAVSRRPTTTRRPRTTTPNPTYQMETTRRPTVHKPIHPSPSKTRPEPTTGSNLIPHVTYPSKYTSRPSTILKFPLTTKFALKRPPVTTLQTMRPPATTLAYRPTYYTTLKFPVTTKIPAPGTGKPIKTTQPMTSATKPKSTPKPAKPILPVPSRPSKPTKAPVPTKSSTKKTIPPPAPSKLPVVFPTASWGSGSTPSSKPKPPVKGTTGNGSVTPTETSHLRWDYRKHCGVRPLRPQGRIVGGRNSFFGEWPWQVLVKEATWLGLFIKNKCGGVLISNKYALTAAHCQPGFLSSLLVVLGEHDLSGDYEKMKPVSVPVRRMIVHRHYNPATFENDLALLEMERPVTFQPHIVPICLPGKNEDFTGRTSYVTGWGKLSHGGSVPNVLQYVQVPILSNNRCQKMFMLAGHAKSIRDNFVCAGYDRGNRDSCEGDSGGPLTLLRDDGRWVLVGTVSHGIRCAEPNMPGVYMRTSAYRSWIDSVTGHKG